MNHPVRTEQLVINPLMSFHLESVRSIARLNGEVELEVSKTIDNLQQRTCFGLVALRGTVVEGYSIYENEAYRVLLRAFGVHPKFHRGGVGSALLDRMKSKLSCAKRNRIVAMVKESSLGAQLFLRDQGFRAEKPKRNDFNQQNAGGYLFTYRMRPCHATHG